jgi:hypothetical protein
VQHGGESRFWSTDAPTGNYDGIGANGQPIVPPAGFSWSHSLANITLEQPWETLFFIDRKVRSAPAATVLRPPPPLLRPPSSVVAQSATYILAALTPRHTVPPADAQVKHEARPFDGERPCHRSVIVQFIRKPVKDGSDKILLDL